MPWFPKLQLSPALNFLLSQPFISKFNCSNWIYYLLLLKVPKFSLLTAYFNPKVNLSCQLRTVLFFLLFFHSPIWMIDKPYWFPIWQYSVFSSPILLPLFRLKPCHPYQDWYCSLQRTSCPHSQIIHILQNTLCDIKIHWSKLFKACNCLQNKIQTS